jgi:putative Mn2+ efflux pump MntP
MVQDKGEADAMLAYMGAEAAAQIGQLIAILLMALALGMDAFSLGLGIGMKGIRLKDVLKISLVVGLFHVLMPLAGMFAGNYVSVLLGNVATLCGGLLLIILGMHMVLNSLRGDQVKEVFDYRTLFGLLIFAFSVSIDSFSVGITLGLLRADIMLAVTLFGFFGCVMSVCGLLLGKRFSGIFGDYSEAVGGIILIVFGTKFLW